ncbi:heme-dependent oxidative N-demethylase subunit alpha family protein [Roseiconus lacunae]|uniref:DUF3445 domain-containing protein n=1 Tax=Roseiconus lacunae TaxID=2605694 RepID=A0ABT7PJS5_9BACT|nr:heme-dependent oxidative N-demethylase subunit alpha family protein [Roseiconus lacunae]MDM4016749.1 DUF3445 domain-containing protein [Roseiconus lacunae]
MIELFPLQRSEFQHQFGISAMPAHVPIFRTIDCHGDKVLLKRELLSGAHRDHYLVQSPSDRPGFQTDTDHRSFDDPPNRRLNRFVTWAIERSEHLSEDSRSPHGDIEPFDAYPPLEWLYRQTQEDIVFLSPEPPFVVTGGCVCFPSGWSLPNKVGQPLLEVHDGVPGFAEQLWKKTSGLMSRLKIDRSVWRSNWGIRPSPDLDQSLRRTASVQSQRDQINKGNAMRHCYFRVEFQTLTKLDEIGIVFTIRTTQCPLASLTTEQLTCLRDNLRSCPEATLRYKGIAPMLDAICTGIERQLNASPR